MRLSKKLSMAACTMALTAMTTAAMAAPTAVPMEKLYNISTEGDSNTQTTISFTAKELTDTAPLDGSESASITITTKDGKLLGTFADGKAFDLADKVDMNSLTQEQKDLLKKMPMQIKLINSKTAENGDVVASISCTPAAEVAPSVSINN